MTDYTARETWYNGIPMRSRLEAGFAQALDQKQLSWKYEGTAFASRHGQYLPDFVVEDHVYYEVKSEGKGTADVLERMKVILATDASATLVVVEGVWINGEYEFRLMHRWPEPRPLVTYYVYNVPGCDSWHHLPEQWDTELNDEQPGPDIYKAIAEEVFPDVACYYEQKPRAYVLPDSDNWIGLTVWAVAFHKGDAALVSTTALPWLSDYLVGTTER